MTVDFYLSISKTSFIQKIYCRNAIKIPLSYLTGNKLVWQKCLLNNWNLIFDKAKVSNNSIFELNLIKYWLCISLCAEVRPAYMKKLADGKSYRPEKSHSLICGSSHERKLFIHTYKKCLTEDIKRRSSESLLYKVLVGKKSYFMPFFQFLSDNVKKWIQEEKLKYSNLIMEKGPKDRWVDGRQVQKQTVK